MSKLNREDISYSEAVPIKIKPSQEIELEGAKRSRIVQVIREKLVEMNSVLLPLGSRDQSWVLSSDGNHPYPWSQHVCPISILTIINYSMDG